MFESISFCSKQQCTHKICENKKEFCHFEHTRSKKKTTTSFIFFKSVNEIKIRGNKRKRKNKPSWCKKRKNDGATKEKPTKRRGKKEGEKQRGKGGGRKKNYKKTNWIKKLIFYF